MRNYVGDQIDQGKILDDCYHMTFALMAFTPKVTLLYNYTLARYSFNYIFM